MPRHFALSTAKLGTMPRPSALSTDLLIWQLADSAFPTGGFAHSFGLEAAWHHGGVDGRSLPAFVRDAVGQVCRGVASAAVRLGLVGTTEAQRIIGETAGEIERTLARCSMLAIDDAAQTAPLIDLWQSSHDRLYSRLFQS